MELMQSIIIIILLVCVARRAPRYILIQFENNSNRKPIHKHSTVRTSIPDKWFVKFWSAINIYAHIEQTNGPNSSRYRIPYNTRNKSMTDKTLERHASSVIQSGSQDSRRNAQINYLYAIQINRPN